MDRSVWGRSAREYRIVTYPGCTPDIWLRAFEVPKQRCEYWADGSGGQLDIEYDSPGSAYTPVRQKRYHSAGPRDGKHERFVLEGAEEYLDSQNAKADFRVGRDLGAFLSQTCQLRVASSRGPRPATPGSNWPPFIGRGTNGKRSTSWSPGGRKPRARSETCSRPMQDWRRAIAMYSKGITETTTDVDCFRTGLCR